MIDTIWNEFLKIVAQEAGSHVVQTWLKAVCLTQWDALEKKVYLKAPNVFIKEWIKSHYLELFQLHLSRLLNVSDVKIIFVESQGAQLTKMPSPDQIIPAVATSDLAITIKKHAVTKRHIEKFRSTINKNYLFDTFVVGPSNQLAYAAAHAVTEKIGSLYNPLFIYGRSGLGKTHLLHAIGNEIKSQNKRATILYQTADHFVNEFINAIRFDKVQQFKEKYTDIDVLLVDDVQFISNKEQTQEVFFHIFNSLYESHKQIVFSSDSDPAGINGLAERLRSRFQWGLVSDIQVPSTETKIAILKHKAEISDLHVNDEVIHYIASCGMTNIRELEGSLIRMSAFSALTHQPISIELAKKIFSRSYEKKEQVIDFNAIIKCLNKYYSFTMNDLRSQARDKDLALIRQIAMYLMKKFTNKSLQEIGHFLGRKDHTTVMHALEKIRFNIENDAVFNAQIKKIEHEINR